MDGTLENLGPLIEVGQYERQMDLLVQIRLRGSSADRQRRVFHQSDNNFRSILKSLMSELQNDIPERDLDIKRKNKANTKKGGTQCA